MKVKQHTHDIGEAMKGSEKLKVARLSIPNL